MRRTEFDCEDLNCKSIFQTRKVLKSNVYLAMYLHNITRNSWHLYYIQNLETQCLTTQPNHDLLVACYIDLEETPAWCILPWVLVSRMESVVALWTPHSWWLPWQEIVMCIIYASLCTTHLTHINYTLYHTHIHYIPCIQPCIYAYKHTWIQMSDYYSWPQSSSVSNESSGTRIFQRTVSAQVRPAIYWQFSRVSPWEFMLNIIFVTHPLLDVVGGKCTSFPAINVCK